MSLYQKAVLLCCSANSFQTDGRARISSFWIPTGGISKKAAEGEKGITTMSYWKRQRLTGIQRMQTSC